MKPFNLTVLFLACVCSVASAVITIDGRTIGPTPYPGGVVVRPKTPSEPKGERERTIRKIDPNAVTVVFDVSKIGAPLAIETREKFLVLYALVDDGTPENKPMPRDEFLKRLNGGEAFTVTMNEEARCQVCKGLGTTGSKLDNTERTCNGCSGTKKQSVPTNYKIINSRPPIPTPVPVPVPQPSEVKK